MKDEIDPKAERNVAIAIVVAVAILPISLPVTVASFVGWRVLFGWWPWQEPWSGPRYNDVPKAKVEK